jgi:3-hydroxyisobutyrate dehydrogenase
MKKLRVGFIGLGLMGNLMAKNIAKSGFPLSVYNRTPAKTREFGKLGVHIAESPGELAEVSDVIITMVTGAHDVEDVLFGPHGVTSSGGLQRGTVVDMSTIGPTAAKSIGKKLESHGIHFLDAPVTGGTYGAESGELTVFIGGKKDVYEKVKPVISSMGNNLHYMGGVGSGQAIKMINNFLIASSLVALSEGMMLADSMGLERKTLAGVLSTTPAVSLAMKRKLPNYVARVYPLNFTIKNMHKDLSLAAAEMGSNQALAMLTLVHAVYKKASEGGLSEGDYSQIIDALENGT